MAPALVAAFGIRLCVAILKCQQRIKRLVFLVLTSFCMSLLVQPVGALWLGLSLVRAISTVGQPLDTPTSRLLASRHPPMTTRYSCQLHGTRLCTLWGFRPPSLATSASQATSPSKSPTATSSRPSRNEAKLSPKSSHRMSSLRCASSMAAMIPGRLLGLNWRIMEGRAPLFKQFRATPVVGDTCETSLPLREKSNRACNADTKTPGRTTHCIFENQNYLENALTVHQPVCRCSRQFLSADMRLREICPALGWFHTPPKSLPSHVHRGP